MEEVPVVKTSYKYYLTLPALVFADLDAEYGKTATVAANFSLTARK